MKYMTKKQVEKFNSKMNQRNLKFHDYFEKISKEITKKHRKWIYTNTSWDDNDSKRVVFFMNFEQRKDEDKSFDLKVMVSCDTKKLCRLNVVFAEWREDMPEKKFDKEFGYDFLHQMIFKDMLKKFEKEIAKQEKKR